MVNKRTVRILLEYILVCSCGGGDGDVEDDKDENDNDESEEKSSSADRTKSVFNLMGFTTEPGLSKRYGKKTTNSQCLVHIGS